MIATIRADFYRLVRSKGFWITETFCLLTVIMAVLFRTSSRFGVYFTTSSYSQAAQQTTEKLTGINALAHFSGRSDTVIFFTIILICLVLGVDLARKLYKNTLAYGISKTEFFLSKLLVSSCLAVLQFILLLASSFALASLINGLGTIPHNFWQQLALTSLVQICIILAWISIISFTLYASHSMAAAVVSFFIGNALLISPLVLYPHIKWLRYLTLQFDFGMATNLSTVIQASLTALALALIFVLGGHLLFQRKDL